MLPIILKADRFIALSQLIIGELEAAGVSAEKIVKIPNGVEVDTILPKTDYCLHDPMTLIFVGRLHSQKRLDVLLSAFQKAAVARPHLRWRLLLVGDGPLRATLEKLAQELDGRGEIRFCGQVSDVFSQLAQADLFVLPSHVEGMSNALLEAMAHGLPCIASRIGGNSDVIIDGQNGRLVDCTEPDQLTQAIVELVDDNCQRKQLGQAARRTIENDFAIAQIAKQYIELYHSLVRNHGPEVNRETN
jgi:glycosyltransferase involved in cell wall biosynthesis